MLTDDHKLKISNAMKKVRLEKPGFIKGHAPWNKGKSPSGETIKKISEGLKGIKQSKETIAKRSASLMGRRGWAKGIKLSEERKAKMRGRTAWNKGKTILPQQREALFKANWKGGRINNQGYIRVRCEGHPRATAHGHYVLEHILVMEKQLKRLLKGNEVVHHINGIRNDNRTENLIVLTRSAHSKLHHL